MCSLLSNGGIGLCICIAACRDGGELGGALDPWRGVDASFGFFPAPLPVDASLTTCGWKWDCRALGAKSGC